MLYVVIWVLRYEVVNILQILLLLIIVGFAADLRFVHFVLTFTLIIIVLDGLLGLGDEFSQQTVQALNLGAHIIVLLVLLQNVFLQKHSLFNQIAVLVFVGLEREFKEVIN